MSQRLIVRLVLLVSLLSLLVGCAAATPEPAPTPTTAPVAAEEPTAAPEPTEAAPEPTAEPTEAPAAEEPETPSAKTAAADELVLATTTSTENSGLLAYLLPEFEQENSVKVSVIAVGTGQSLALGENGDADVVLVHARALEDAFMEASHGVRREDVMYNDFIILGPADDPAGVTAATDAAEALSLIAESESTFVSRGDDSGTHVKEKDVWAAAGIDPDTLTTLGDWYVSAGQGMGGVLTMANELQAYTLSDRATYLARTLEGTDLVILAEGDPILFNPYGIIAVNPDKGPHIKAELANTFIDWFVSVPTQERIAEFGVEDFGSSLFVPDSALWREAQGGKSGVALVVSGDVAIPSEWTLDDLQDLDQIEALVENKEGGTDSFWGAALTELLAEADPDDEATLLVLVADDGFESEIALEDALACDTCVVTVQDDGTLRAAMPGMTGKAQVKGLVELRID